MSQISKCPKLRVVLGYWEALGEVSEMRYIKLLYSSSKRSYCSGLLADPPSSGARNSVLLCFICETLQELQVVNIMNVVNMMLSYTT